MKRRLYDRFVQNTLDDYIVKKHNTPNTKPSAVEIAVSRPRTAFELRYIGARWKRDFLIQIVAIITGIISCSIICETFLTKSQAHRADPTCSTSGYFVIFGKGLANERYKYDEVNIDNFNGVQLMAWAFAWIAVVLYSAFICTRGFSAGSQSLADRFNCCRWRSYPGRPQGTKRCTVDLEQDSRLQGRG